MMAFDPDRDLLIERFMRAEPEAVWRAWTTPDLLERWWVPAPALCRVEALELRPGGAFRTLLSEGEGPFMPHIDGCFLLLEENRRLIFTNALSGGFRPANDPFITAEIRLEPVTGGTHYSAHVMHKDRATRDTHVELGFYEGWGTVTEQLAATIETRNG
jgi:uncharacterized protein YndB with AHSA1/START domain